MSLFDIYKAKILGAGAGSLFDAKAGGKLNKDAWKKGFNKWDEEWEPGLITTASGQPSNSDNYIRSKNFNDCIPSTYYAIMHGSSHQLVIFWYDADYTFISFGLSDAANKYNVVQAPSNAVHFKIRFGDSNVQTYSNDICVNISGDHDGEYVPYNG